MEKPLHVRVAEALGWTNCQFVGWVDYRGDGSVHEDKRHWVGISPWQSEKQYPQRVPLHDTDWSATGPLIEKHGIDLSMMDASEWPDGWGASAAGIPWTEIMGFGPTPLIAVCELILKLAAAGKLEEGK